MTNPAKSLHPGRLFGVDPAGQPFVEAELPFVDTVAERLETVRRQLHSTRVLLNNAFNMRKRDGSVSRLLAEQDRLVDEMRALEAQAR